jgi:hypothetical protein
MRRIVAVSIGLLLLVGCTSSNTTGVVSGTVTYKTQPVNGATLLLYSASGGQEEKMTIPVAQDGTFKTSDVPVGDYKVVVQPNAGGAAFNTKGMTPEQLEKMKDQIAASKIPPTIQIPPKYTKLNSTDLQMTVGKGSQTVPLELKD